MKNAGNSGVKHENPEEMMIDCLIKIGRLGCAFYYDHCQLSFYRSLFSVVTHVEMTFTAFVSSERVNVRSWDFYDGCKS